MNGVEYGPYSLDEFHELDVPDDVEVMEESVQEWAHASDYPSYEELKARESGYTIERDGTLKREIDIQVDENKREYSIFNRLEPTNDSKTIAQEANEDNVVPVNGWNWGAFFFNWIWGLFNGVYWPFPVFFVSCFIPDIGAIVILVGSIILGINGNKWSWENKTWSNATAFNRAQHRWSLAVIWYLAICFIMFIVAVIVVSVSKQ